MTCLCIYSTYSICALCVVFFHLLLFVRAAVPDNQVNCNSYNYLGGSLRKLVQVSSGIDDAEQLVCSCTENGKVKCTDSSDLEMVKDDEREGGGNQLVAIRFRNIPSTNGLIRSTLCFTVEDDDEKAFTFLTIRAVNALDTSSTNLCSRNAISNLPVTDEYVEVGISQKWNTVGAVKCFATNLNPILEEIRRENGNNNLEGKAVTFVISGYGNREVYSYDGNACKAPVLLFDYEAPSCGCAGTAFTCDSLTKCPISNPFNNNADSSRFCFCGNVININNTPKASCLASIPNCNNIGTPCTTAATCGIGETCQRQSCCSGRPSICNKVCAAGFPDSAKAAACVGSVLP